MTLPALLRPAILVAMCGRWPRAGDINLFREINGRAELNQFYAGVLSHRFVD